MVENIENVWKKWKTQYVSYPWQYAYSYKATVIIYEKITGVKRNHMKP